MTVMVNELLYTVCCHNVCVVAQSTYEFGLKRISVSNIQSKRSAFLDAMRVSGHNYGGARRVRIEPTRWRQEGCHPGSSLLPSCASCNWG